MVFCRVIVTIIECIVHNKRTKSCKNDHCILLNIAVSLLYNVLYVINDTNEIVSLSYAQSYFHLNTFNHTGNVYVLPFEHTH
jgi:hypothetical protein